MSITSPIPRERRLLFTVRGLAVLAAVARLAPRGQNAPKLPARAA